MTPKDTTQKINKTLFLFLFIFLVFLIFFNNLAQARTYEIKASCSKSLCDWTPCWPTVIPPACSADFDEVFYADMNSPSATIGIPADYDASTSDPWISSISSHNDRIASGSTITTIVNAFSYRANRGTSGVDNNFYFKNDNGNVIASSLNVSAAADPLFIYFACAYRICAEQDPCDRDSSPTCDTDPANPCLELPGSCFVKTDGSEACKYTLIKDLCNADGDDCTLDTCVYTDEGANASCAAGLNFCSGIVPCGRLANNPSTSWDETKECQLCHIVILSSSVINFLMEIVILISILAIVVMGLINVISGGNASLSLAARKNINKVLYGFVLVFIAWAIVNVAMVLFGFSDPLGDGSWAIFTCNVP